MAFNLFNYNPTAGGGPTLTADNGITINSNVIELGGTLTKYTTIDLAGFQMQIGTGDTFFNISESTGAIEQQVGDGSSQGYIGVSVAQGTIMEIRNPAALTKGVYASPVSGEGITVADQIDQIGLLGQQDFSANYEDESYVQKIYVDSLLINNIVSSGKFPGQNASFNVVTFVTEATEGLYRVSATVNQTAGAGTCAINASYTDTNNNASGTQTLANTAATGPTPIASQHILNAYCKALTNIVINLVLTGACIADVSYSIELIA